MRRKSSLRLIVFLLATAGVGALVLGAGAQATPKWSMNATIIEACSCPMFCQCYFGTHPAEHHGPNGGHF